VAQDLVVFAIEMRGFHVDEESRWNVEVFLRDEEFSNESGLERVDSRMDELSTRLG